MMQEAGRAERVRTLFTVFFKISALAVGGGLTMLPLIDEAFTEKRKWMTDEEMVDCVAVVQSMPGIIGCNIAAAAGYRIAGIPGVLAALAGVALPPFLVILLVAMCFLNLSGNTWIDHAFLGVRSAICALILSAAVKLGRSILKAPFPILLAGASFCILTFFPQINVLWVILGGAALGLCRSYVLKRKGKTS